MRKALLGIGICKIYLDLESNKSAKKTTNKLQVFLVVLYSNCQQGFRFCNTLRKHFEAWAEKIL